MHRATLRLLIAVSVCGVASSPSFADWLLIHEIRAAQVNLYQQQSRYFVDTSSSEGGTVEGIRYELASFKTESYGKGTSIDQMAVICGGTPIAPAMSIRKMGGVQPDGSVKVALDFGPLKSLSDFRLSNLDRDPGNIFFLVAQAVCKERRK